VLALLVLWALSARESKGSTPIMARALARAFPFLQHMADTNRSRQEPFAGHRERTVVETAEEL
jgi:hypothetical protein